jgi:hypothetical protein
MLVAAIGPALATDLGLAPAWANEEPKSLTFGSMEPLAGLMRDTPREKLLPALVEKLKAGTDLRTLVAAAALANARTFGGQDYVGYHSFMALAPAFEMARELPEDRGALPVLKVLYRNTSRMQEVGDKKADVLQPITAADLPKDQINGERLREDTRRGDMGAAEHTFAAIARGPAGEAFNHLQFSIQDEVDVHRIVLAWRAWSILDLTGKEQAHTLLRQSVRYCVDSQQYLTKNGRQGSGIRTLLPKLLDQYRLLSRPMGDRRPDDAWVVQLSETVYGRSRDQAAEAVAAALADGMSPEAVGEGIALAANRLVLCDPGRREGNGPKPAGSVHGDSVGVHASDAANAWRNIARVSNARNAVASLIAAAYHTAGQSGGQHPKPFPLPEHLEGITTKEAGRLLQMVEAAIKAKEQALACALVARYGELGHPPRPIFDLLLRYAVSEDGALHAEKYYRTVTEEFAAMRPAFRWRQLAALARVTASQFGFPAPGYAEACRLLNV